MRNSRAAAAVAATKGSAPARGGKARQGERPASLKIIHWIHLFEGIAMLITGPILMLFPQLVLSLYAVSPQVVGAAVAADVVPWFGALVVLMGWVETRCWGRMLRPMVEAWLIADVLYLLAFYVFVERHGQWNLWSFALSALFPILYAPLRVYWLWLAPSHIQPKSFA
ncbi:hypothetical protein QOT17_015552 [Balamuthia mandrillaris]